LEARGSTDGERKTITALFADLTGSTALIEGLDPEEARAIIDPALQLMMDAVPVCAVSQGSRSLCVLCRCALGTSVTNRERLKPAVAIHPLETGSDSPHE
jgi:hypothetical protein